MQRYDVGRECILVNDFSARFIAAKILGDSEVFIDVGSMLNLTCIVPYARGVRPAFILWYHGQEVSPAIYNKTVTASSITWNLRNLFNQWRMEPLSEGPLMKITHLVPSKEDSMDT